MNEPQVQYDKFTTFVNTPMGKIVLGLLVALVFFLMYALAIKTGGLRMFGACVGGFAFGYFYLPGFLIKQADKKAAAAKKDAP
jgi:hypothetical protein